VTQFLWFCICVTTSAISFLFGTMVMAVRKPMGDSAIANECEAQRKRADLAEQRLRSVRKAANDYPGK
jgi:hypothetical protein